MMTRHIKNNERAWSSNTVSHIYYSQSCRHVSQSSKRKFCYTSLRDRRRVGLHFISEEEEANNMAQRLRRAAATTATTAALDSESSGNTDEGIQFRS